MTNKLSFADIGGLTIAGVNRVMWEKGFDLVDEWETHDGHIKHEYKKFWYDGTKCIASAIVTFPPWGVRLAI